MWERGLKYSEIKNDLLDQLSLPVWERGLKFSRASYFTIIPHVAPRVGAWIEITDVQRLFNQ